MRTQPSQLNPPTLIPSVPFTGGTLITEGANNRAKLIADADYDHYQVMYRYYYEDATALAAAGTPTIDSYNLIWWTEWKNGEHDVPPCYADPCVDSITSNVTGADLPGTPRVACAVRVFEYAAP